jgi:hypothetical protein
MTLYGWGDNAAPNALALVGLQLIEKSRAASIFAAKHVAIACLLALSERSICRSSVGAPTLLTALHSAVHASTTSPSEPEGRAIAHRDLKPTNENSVRKLLGRVSGGTRPERCGRSERDMIGSTHA